MSHYQLFLSSVTSAIELVNMMSPQISDESVITNYSESLWSSINESQIPENKKSQKGWDLIVVKRLVDLLTLSSDE